MAIHEQVLNDSIALLLGAICPKVRQATQESLLAGHNLPPLPTPTGVAAAYPFLPGGDIWTVQPDGYVPLIIEGKPDGSPPHAVPVGRVLRDGPRPNDLDSAAWYASVLADLNGTPRGARWHPYPDEECCGGRLHTLPNNDGKAALAVPQIAWALHCDWLGRHGMHADARTVLVLLTSQGKTVADVYWDIDVPRAYLTRETDFLNALAARLSQLTLDPASTFTAVRAATMIWARLPCAQARFLTPAALALVSPGALTTHQRQCAECSWHSRQSA